MAYETISYELANHVAEVKLDRPEAHNLLTETATRELVDVLKRVSGEPDAHVVLLYGTGASFCAGGDMDEFMAKTDRRAPALYEDERVVSQLFRCLHEYEKPIIGGINGHALGGGCGLAAACHLSYASAEATFGTTEVRFGVFPLVITIPLRRKIGRQATLELALTGERISAEEAAEFGMVSDVYEPSNVVDAARSLARDIASKSPSAVQRGLHALEITDEMPADDAIEVLNAYRALSFHSQDLEEGAQAFVEDREPEWADR